MRCPHCQRPLLALFYTTVCESCEAPPRGDFYAGFIVWDPARELSLEAPRQVYVWRTAHDAMMWRSLRETDDLTVRCVLSELPISWRQAGGKAAGLICADGLFEIFADHRFPSGPYRAFLAPPNFHPHAERVTFAA